MERISKDAAIPHDNGNHCRALEYEFAGETDINVAVIELTGRYPDTGYCYNEVCKEEMYVADGQGSMTISDTVNQIKKGDMLLIQPGDRYFLDGAMTLVIAASPAWYPDQHKTTN
jgi:mannose-6-phosphate isomerase-like protein (cupin superfamily)